jgi:hypothetical protein
MILLTSTSDRLRLVTSTAGDIRVQASYVDLSGSTVTPGRLNSAISTATTTDIVASPGASTQRNIKGVSIWNDSTTTSNQVTVIHTDGTTAVDLIQMSLPPLSGLQYVDGQGWSTYGDTRPTNVQTFSASGTWAKPTNFNARVVLVRVWGAGGGGGGGSSLATATVTKGGGGGGGGCLIERIFLASDLANDVSVTIGAGGSAGTGAAAGGSGGDGGVGGNTTFGSLLTGYGGGGGRGGQNSALATGGGGGGGGHSAGQTATAALGGNGGQPTSAGPGFDIQGVTGAIGSGNAYYGHFGGGGGGGSTNAAAATAGGGSLFGGGGGGSGGGTSAVPAANNPTTGGGFSSSVGGGGAAGVSAGTSGPAPVPGDAGGATNGTTGGAGGGGGGSTVQASANGAAGGAGGLGGGGGGGGGRGSNPGLGGAGGIGGAGYCVVISW